MTGYAFHPEAELDLDEIWEFIANGSLDAADRVVAEIRDAIASAVRSPHRGHRRPDLDSRGLRFLVVYEYLIAYAPDEQPLWVVAVVHGRRSPRVLASILNDRQ